MQVFLLTYLPIKGNSNSYWFNMNKKLHLRASYASQMIFDMYKQLDKQMDHYRQY